MLKRNFRCAASAVLVAALCAPVLHADDKPSSIDQLAPENSVLVVGATNVAESMERLKATRLWDFWQGPDGKSMREKFDEGMKELLEEMSTDLEMEVEEFPMPTGAAGFAMFSVEDDDTGMIKPAFLAYADFGDNAEKVYNILQKMMDQGEEKGTITVEALNLMDREGWRLEFVQPEEDAGGMDDEGEEDFEQWNAGPSGPPFDAMEFIKEGSMLMVCTDHHALEQALAARDGEDIDSIADRNDHRAIKQKIGEGEIYGALLMRDFWQTLEAFQGGGGGMMMMVVPMINEIFGRIDGAGWTVGLNGENAMVEQTWFVSLPEGKKGLLSLIGAETGRPRVPAFVSPEAASYFAVNVDTAAIGPFVRQMMQNPMLGGQIDQQTQEDVIRRISEVFATMGNELHVTSRINRPLAADSQRMLIAMKCDKPQEFENLIAKEAPQIGLESRDFLGQRIYELDPGGGTPWSLGIGGGYVVIGPSTEVELALRTADEKEPVTLEGDIDFKRVVMALGAEKGVAWAFADLVDTIETNMRIQIMTMRQQAEEYREWSPEYADQMLEQAKEMEAQLETMPSTQSLRRYIGPTAWYVRSIEEGLLGKSYIMPGTDE